MADLTFKRMSLKRKKRKESRKYLSLVCLIYVYLRVNMGDFLRRVRGDEIPGPLRREFTKKKWNDEFKKCIDPDVEDLALFKSGVLVSDKLKNIRNSLKLSNSSSLSATTKLRAFVAMANHEFIVNAKRTHEAMGKLAKELQEREVNGYGLEDLTNIKLKLKGGFAWGPNEIVEGLVDGMEIPIRFALQGSPVLSGAPKMNLVAWKEMAHELNLGTLYRMIEDIWNDCLWNGYVSADEAGVILFLPTDLDVVKSYSLGLARRNSLSGTFNILSAKYYRELYDKGIFPNIREVKSIERKGKHQVIKVSKNENPSDAYQDLMAMWAFASEPYYTELLNEAQPKLAGLNLSLLTRVWTVISQTSQILLRKLTEKHNSAINPDALPHAWFPEYVPVIQVTALVDALSVATGINRIEAARAVEFFTYRGAGDQEIWAQPLIPVGNVSVAPYFPAIVSPNLRRLIDVWMKQAGVDLGRRGPEFEAHIRASVSESIKTSPLLANFSKSLSDDYTFKPVGSRSEQIDLLFFIGKTVFVAEAKCILEPVDSKGVAMHRKTVNGAAIQVLRKARSIEENRSDFVDSMRKFGWDISANFEVISLVITSSSSHVGFESQGVPVIDELILGRFFDGCIENVALAGDGLKVVKKINTIFYSTVEEAEKIATQYFKSPPQLERFFKGVQPRIVPIYPVDKDDWEGLISSFECFPLGGPWEDDAKSDLAEAV
ncbi:hypothetical protein [Janthinobacterium sp. SUN137]|uniref:hypothetical protein n=1 Tax=Janthinobacterium sp. SUN137 TaxID=3014789 RepID=UPI0027143CB6|nr:hypothetical protein [Janthinobacterium sp. SUN137]MDO8039199.1 hypothetical protein [Janthinobacterium sp. SUN137]